MNPLPSEYDALLREPNAAVIGTVTPSGRPHVLMEDWAQHITVRGRVTEFVGGEQGMDDVDRIARHYTGRPYRIRDRERVSAYIEIASWYVWGF